MLEESTEPDRLIGIHFLRNAVLVRLHGRVAPRCPPTSPPWHRVWPPPTSRW